MILQALERNGGTWTVIWVVIDLNLTFGKKYLDKLYTTNNGNFVYIRVYENYWKLILIEFFACIL